MNQTNTVVGSKADNGKAPIIQGCFLYFPKALAAVSRCSEYGKKKYNTKYSERNFMFVGDGVGRYSDGLGRHLAGEMEDAGGIDKESGLPHAYMVAWNALARLEIMLTEINKIDDSSLITQNREEGTIHQKWVAPKPTLQRAWELPLKPTVT